MVKQKIDQVVNADQAKKKERVSIAAEDFPRKTLQDALRVAEVLHKNYGGKSASWEEIASVLGVNPATAPNKYPLWSAIAYGLLTKSEDNQYELSETARKILAPEFPGEAEEGKIKAILTPKILSKFLTDFDGHCLPEEQHFPNVLENRYKIPRDRTPEAIRIILDNADSAGILKKAADGTATIELNAQSQVPRTSASPDVRAETPKPDELKTDAEAYDWDKVCFHITPIGDDSSEQRRHADMILKHVVDPAAKENGLEVVRADKIERSGLITQQIFEQLVKSKVCVADLSFSNANVFYELGVRHTCKLPAVQIIRKGDKIPFDVAQGRTITIDTSDIYSIADRLASAQRELSQHLKHIMASEHNEPSEDNPVHLYLPKLRVTVG